MLTLRPTLIAGETAPDDYTVREDGREIGRIRRAAERIGETWLWNVTVNIPGAGNGTADGLEAAKTAFRQSWSQLKQSAGAGRLAEAFEEADAARNRPRR